MKQNFMTGRGEIVVETVPEPTGPLGPGFVRVAVAHSLISTGTDRALIESSGGGSFARKLGNNPSLFRKVYSLCLEQGLSATRNAILDKLHTLLPLGYSCAGTIIACGPDTAGLVVGQRVACAGVGFANHAEIVTVPRNLVVPVPDTLSTEHACFVALGAIAQQGVRQANVQFGERIAVLGLGLVGQLAVMQARQAGLRVVGIDKQPGRAEVARTLGAEIALTLTAPEFTETLAAITQGQGFDAVLIAAASPSADAFNLAATILRDRGTISLVGIVGLPAQCNPVIGKEIKVVGSRSYGPGRYDRRYEEKGIDYPIGYVRWSENRNMQFFIEALARKEMSVAPLLSKQYPVAEAAQAYGAITGGGGGDIFGVVVSYPEQPARPRAWTPADIGGLAKPAAGGRPVRIGLWGLGGFARGTHLPNLKSLASVDLVALGSNDGGNAVQAGQRFGVGTTVSSFEALLDSGIEAVLLCGRHNEHAAQVETALRRKIAVFVEKPLTIRASEVDGIESAWRETGGTLMVGHNRKFSPAFGVLLEALRNRQGPAHVLYRVATRALPPGYWMSDSDIGGGQLISELSHFTDSVLALVRSTPEQIRGVFTDRSKSGISCQLSFVDGSTATILYLTQSNPEIGKEYLEAHFDGLSFRLDDFLRLSGGRRAQEWKIRDKGHRAGLEAFIGMVKDPAAATARALTGQDLLATRLMFALIDSAEAGGRIVDLRDGAPAAP